MSWTSSKPEVAAIDAKGNVTAKAPGSAVITATANADKTVTQTCKVTVNPSKISSLKITRAKNKAAIKLKWKKQSGDDGCQVWRSEKKKGPYKQIKNLKKASSVTYTDKKAKKGNRYYYKVRAYKKAGKKTI